ncbi:ABC transporter permease [Jeotgalicoccus huakuii]|uniref:ABC transporter permease n=1 Tax=Jeotgalicoccus sp. ATCC 8456 TaxID=946435 RepID=UPI0018E61E99|nr:ABC transporter permease [Jeotgalicoccus sp. ATCC 8456]MCK1975489.1 ABC transporter permease [Jeotgalicoccus huakuii]QQD85684.1 ABC transporter permease [Jeotgalicoccus sp. ATCC 8456]
MKNVFALLKENFENLPLIWKLSLYNLKASYANHYLGLLWTILMPAAQVGVFYVVFGLGLRGDRGDVQNVPFLVYLITGIFAFGFISGCVNASSNAISSQINLVTKMKFPSSILLSMSVMNNVISFIIMTLIVLVISLVNGYSEPSHYLVWFYFMFATIAFSYSIGLIMSSVNILIRDFKNVQANVMRMFFFVTPIFWEPEGRPPLMSIIMAFNPFAYLLMTFRNALIFDGPAFYGTAADHIYFWSITLFLFFVGVQVHYRYKDRLVDYL